MNTQDRTVNIISRAVCLGFEFNEDSRIEDIRIAAEAYLIENTDHTEEECEVRQIGNHGQRVDWNDGKGYEYWAQGEIVEWGANWHKEPDHRVIHSTIVDTHANVIDLYYLVGETEYNAPDGYFYHNKLGRHIPFED